MKNKVYTSSGLIEKYSIQRNRWEDFYESERRIMGKVFGSMSHFSLLDAGCGCGGLLKAIQDRFSIDSYHGVDINEEMIAYAKNRLDLGKPHSFNCMDICDLNGPQYDIVISFSCVDYNEDVFGMLNTCWGLVKRGGYLIASFRLTDQESILRDAYQTIDPYDERYNYVVFNFSDLKSTLCSLLPCPSDFECYGYWGAPSTTAVVARDRLCFSVFAIHKPLDGQCVEIPRMILDLPADVL